MQTFSQNTLRQAMQLLEHLWGGQILSEEDNDFFAIFALSKKARCRSYMLDTWKPQNF